MRIRGTDGRADTSSPGRLWLLGAVGDKPARWAGVCGVSVSERNNRLLTVAAFPLIAGRASASLWQTCSDTVLQRMVALKIAGLTLRINRQTSEYRFPFLSMDVSYSSFILQDWGFWSDLGNLPILSNFVA